MNHLFKRVLFTLILTVFAVSFANSQEYLTPSPIIKDDVQVKVTDVVKSDEIIKFRLTIHNTTTDHYFAYAIKQTQYDLPNMGTITAEGRDKLIIIPPGEKKFFVVNGKVAAQSAFPRFDLNLNGLFKAEIPSEGVSSDLTELASGATANFQQGTISLDLPKLAQKKGVFSAQGEVKLDGTLAAPKELLIFDPSQLRASGDGTNVAANNPDDLLVIYPGGKKKIKFNMTTPASTVQATLGNALKRLSLSKVVLDPVSVSDGSKIYKTCDSHTAGTNGSIKINVSSEVGCFKFSMLGENLTPQMTSNLTFNMNPSSKKVRVTMDNGAVIEKSIYAKDDYKALYYRIKEKDGKYVLRYMPGASELADGRSSSNQSNSGNQSNNNQSMQTQTYTNTSCPAVNANTQGTTLIKINSEVGCFHLHLMGQKMTNSPTSNFSFKANSSSKKVKIIMDNGITFEKNLLIGQGYETLYYSVKEKNGKYSLKQNFMAAEMSQATTSHEVTCKDVITDFDFNTIRDITIQEITGDRVYFKACGSENIQSMSKHDLLKVAYSDGSCDLFDYDGGPKRGLNIRRSPSVLMEKHKSSNTKTQSCSGYVIGPNR